MKKNVITPSTAATGVNCPNSENFDRQTARGVLLHEIAAAILQGNEERIELLKSNTLYNSNGGEMVKFYTDYIRSRANPEEITVELAVDLRFGDTPIRGKLDALIKNGAGIEVVDFKTSASEIDWNQVKVYAYMEASLYKAEKIRVTVVQPRHRNKIETRLLDKNDLIKIRTDIIDKLEDMSLDCNPSKNCKFCPVRGFCRTLYNYYVKMAISVMTLKEKVRFLKMKPQIMEAFTEAELTVTEALKNGIELDSVELKDKRINRYIKPEDTDEAFEILEKALSDDQLKSITKKSISIAKAEELLGREKTFALIGHLIQRERGEKVLKLM